MRFRPIAKYTELFENIGGQLYALRAGPLKDRSILGLGMFSFSYLLAGAMCTLTPNPIEWQGVAFTAVLSGVGGALFTNEHRSAGALMAGVGSLVAWLVGVLIQPVGPGAPQLLGALLMFAPMLPAMFLALLPAIFMRRKKESLPSTF